MESKLARHCGLLLLGFSMSFGVAAQEEGGPTMSAADARCTLDDDDFLDDDDLDDVDDLFEDDDDDRKIQARLRGLCEVPSISTTARGEFRGEIDDAASMITWTLTYEGLESPVQQAHIHLGERHTNGGVSAFLCTNLDNGPPDTPPCPNVAASVDGTIMAAQVVGPEDQGLSAGEFDALIRAIRAGAAYVNVHTESFPAGEIRGQIVDDDDDDDDDDYIL